MEHQIECPLCLSEALLDTRYTTIIYKEIPYTFERNYYQCSSCKEEITTPEMDEQALKQLYYLAKPQNYEKHIHEQLQILKGRKEEYEEVLDMNINSDVSSGCKRGISEIKYLITHFKRNLILYK